MSTPRVKAFILIEVLTVFSISALIMLGCYWTYTVLSQQNATIIKSNEYALEYAEFKSRMVQACFEAGAIIKSGDGFLLYDKLGQQFIEYECGKKASKKKINGQLVQEIWLEGEWSYYKNGRKALHNELIDQIELRGGDNKEPLIGIKKKYSSLELMKELETRK